MRGGPGSAAVAFCAASIGLPMTEADTCRKFVVPLLQQAGWDTASHFILEQKFFTDGRIVKR